eukprot:gene4101-136_t
MRSGVLALCAVATPAAACNKQKYAQCGGDAFTGNTCCPSGMWCMSTGQWWSQ